MASTSTTLMTALRWGISGAVGFLAFHGFLRLQKQLSEVQAKVSRLEIELWRLRQDHSISKDVNATEAKRNKRAFEDLWKVVNAIRKGEYVRTVDMVHFREVFCKRIAECDGPKEVEAVLSTYDYDQVFLPPAFETEDEESDLDQETQSLDEDQIDGAAGFLLRCFADAANQA